MTNIFAIYYPQKSNHSKKVGKIVQSLYAFITKPNNFTSQISSRPEYADFANEAEIVVPYDAEITAPAVKIFVLNGMGTMVPMDIPVVITDAIQQI